MPHPSHASSTSGGSVMGWHWPVGIIIAVPSVMAVFWFFFAAMEEPDMERGEIHMLWMTNGFLGLLRHYVANAPMGKRLTYAN